MNPIRRELLNALFVLVLSTLLSAAIAAFQVKFNLQVWALLVMGAAIVTSGYVFFEFAMRFMASTDARETEWLRRVGNPARLALGFSGSAPAHALTIDAINAVRAGSDYTVLTHIDRSGADISPTVDDELRAQLFRAIMEQVKRGTIREYKRIICFDHDVFANDPELKSGILRVGMKSGDITGAIAEHCRVMMETNGCSSYVAPVVLRSSTLVFFGADKVAFTLDTVDQNTGTRTVTGSMFFYDPPNGEIIEQFRQIERATEKRMVAVHKIRFPDNNAETLSKVATQ